MVTEDGRKRTICHFYMVVERYLRVEKAKIKPKITLRLNKSLQGLTRPKRPQKCKNTKQKNFKAKSDPKVPNLTSLALRNGKWQVGNPEKSTV